jgi:hypothetical protein
MDDDLARQQRAILARLHARLVVEHDRRPAAEQDQRERDRLVARLVRRVPDRRRRKRLLRKAMQRKLPTGLSRAV